MIDDKGISDKFVWSFGGCRLPTVPGLAYGQALPLVPACAGRARSGAEMAGCRCRAAAFQWAAERANLQRLEPLVIGDCKSATSTLTFPMNRLLSMGAAT